MCTPITRNRRKTRTLHPLTLALAPLTLALSRRERGEVGERGGMRERVI